MKCPYCGYSESKVIDSRPADENSSIRRRRECLSCGKRFTTYETVESLPMVVVKKDGSRQSFDRRKVLGGMIRACEKRPVPLAELEKIAGEIEQDLQNSMEREISTEAIGEQVMEKLKTVDECTGRVVDEIIKHGGKCIITADHGNADQMLDPVHGGAFTAHTTNPVPVIVVDPEHPKYELRQGGRLCDLCPTMLTLMKLPQPKEMTGESLIIG